jgi:hypothetical protein
MGETDHLGLSFVNQPVQSRSCSSSEAIVGPPLGPQGPHLVDELGSLWLRGRMLTDYLGHPGQVALEVGQDR